MEYILSLLREHILNCPVSFTDSFQISKFKAVERALTLPSSRPFPPIPTFSSGFFFVLSSHSFPFPLLLFLPASHHLLSLIIILISTLLFLPLSSPLMQSITHHLLGLRVSFRLFLHSNSKSPVGGLSLS